MFDINFKSNASMEVTVAYPAEPPIDPLPSKEWKKEDTQFALIKYLAKYDEELEKKQIVKSDGDITMVMKSRIFKAGYVQIKLDVKDPIMVMVLFRALKPPPKYSCGGPELELTKLKAYEGCTSDGTPSENACSDAFIEGKFWMPSDNPALLSLKFNEITKPTRVVYKANPETGTNPQIIKIY